MKCSKNLFNKSINTIVIPENWDYNSVNNVISQIIDEFNDAKQLYSLRYDRTTDEETYIDSIDDFIDSVLNEIPQEFSEYDKNRIIHQLRLYYYPPSAKIGKEMDSVPISAIIPEADLLSQHEKASKKLDNTLNDLFGNNVLLKEDCKNKFKRDIFGVIIVSRNGNKSRKVVDVGSLNQNIEDFKNSLYRNVYEYLSKRGISPETQVTQMFVQKAGDNQHNIHPGYSKVLDDFYLLITENNLIDQLEIDWSNKQVGKESSGLLEAVNSYIQLLYFDELLQDSVDNYLSIDDSQDQIFVTDDDGNWIYKYHFGTEKQKAHKLFTEDIKDATKELGVFSRFLIENIPLRNSQSYMTITDYFTAMLKLKDHLMHSAVKSDLKNAMLNFHISPEESMKYIFENIITQDGNLREDIIRLFDQDILDYKLNLNDINIIESLYDYLYKDKNSINNIEHRQFLIEGFDNQFPLVKTILGAFDSVSQMDYAEIVYNYETQKYQLKIKKKYADKKGFYDFIDSINRRSREQGGQVLIDKYSPYFNRKDLHLKIGNNDFVVSSNGETALGFGILNMSGSFGIRINDLQGNQILNPNQHLSTYFDINLETTSSRQKLIDGDNLTEKEQQFLNTISYIDDILGTTFSSSEQGLQELNLYLKQYSSQETGLKKLFLGATKALIATKLNLEYNGEGKLRDFLKENYPFEILSRPTLDRDIVKNYFYNTYRGEFLYGVNKSKSDDWVDKLMEARRILQGESTKATTRNLTGDSIPNTSPAFLGREIQQVLNEENISKENSPSTQFLMFNQNPQAITAVVIDTDVRTKSGKIKNVASFTTPELIYHNFINKFVLPMQQGKMLVQPTVYSDKKKFINYMVDIKSSLENILGKDVKSTYRISSNEFENLIIHTIGEAYYNLYNNVLDDYEKIYGTRDIQRITNIMRTLSSEEFIADAQRVGVDVMEDIHYRKGINGGISPNELLFYYKDLYTNPELLKERLAEEKYKFFNEISRNRVFFQRSSELEDALRQVNGASWIQGDYMAIARHPNTGEYLRFGTLPQNIEYNPLLENYFYSHILFSGNLKLSLIGTELNHKVKALPKITAGLSLAFTKDQISWIKSKVGLKPIDKINFIDIKTALDQEFNPEIYNIYKEQLYKVETAEQNAQLKRTVAVPGTMRYFFQDSLDGIASTMNCAVIEDIKADIYQFSGKQDSPIDAHDGAAFIDPFTSILENYSLQDSAVGTIKKTLWKGFSTRYMSDELVKYAQHTITNQVMRQSEGSSIKMYNMFKKMTDWQWDTREIPDITKMAFHKGNSEISFSKDILKGDKLFYKIGDQSIRIENFGKDDFGYYTEEQAVLSNGDTNYDSNKQKVYHFFGDNGEHYRITEGEIPEGTHTINSLYELHAALGGIWSQSLMDDGELHYSEASNQAVANFMNNVCIPKEGVTSKSLRTQSNFYQPLKTKLINYLLNQSSIKNGAQNINKNSVYTDSNPLRYFSMSTSRYGIQQDSDHEADEARMTEFSQVISSLDAGGFYHDYVREIYQVLGRVAVEASKLELDAVTDYISKIKQSKNPNLNEQEKQDLKNKAFNTLYDIIGRTLISNMRLGGGQAGLATSIMYALRKEFNLSVDHSLDKFIIPLSDSNIYSQILQTISSLINRKSVKREYPGNGMIMTPGFGFIQLWDLDGKVLQFEDILKQVRVIPNNGESLSDANRRSVQEYLMERQKEIPIISNKEEFYPGDTVNVYVDEAIYTISLDSMPKYQQFINSEDLSDFGVVGTPTGFQKNIVKARDLAPSRITYSYIDKNGVQHNSNIFASYIYREIYGNPTREQRQRIQKLLNALDDGFIYLSEEDEINDLRTPIFNYKNIPAEKIASNIYQSKFGMHYYDSINDVVEESFGKPIHLNPSTIYDLVLVKGNGRNVHIAIDSNSSKKRNQWKGLTKVSKLINNIPVNDVYVTEDNIRLFQVGREIIKQGYSYKDGKFYNENQEQVRGDFSYDGTNVWEYIEFVESVKSPLDNGKNFRYYNINRQKLSRVFEGNQKETENYIAKIIKDIYNSDSFEAILPNNIISKEKLPELSSIFYNLGSQTKENSDLQSLLFDISGLLHGLQSDKNDTINLRRKRIGDTSYRTRIQNYRDLLTHKKYISFQKSQDFVTSRIPAQTLQSFMYTRNVGYTGVHTNQCYQSPWETYLQGSDFDIDKSYMMGHEFDDNGIYLGWSNLFDYSDIDTLHASENLPYPRYITYIKGENGININEYVQNITNSTGVERINNIVKLLNFLNTQDGTIVSYDGDEQILNDIINKHNNSYIAPINRVAVMKNFVSSRIQKQIQATKNMLAAYSPIEMTDIGEAAENTPKAKSSSGLSILNPAMLAVMQNQNMVGKNVVGIAANGQKANLMWNYFMNDVIRHATESPYLKYAQFNFKSSRIKNRFLSQGVEVDINGLPDTNFNGVPIEIQDLFSSRLTPNITTDLLGSQYISAATDNAKELILDKINSGQATAKCHLFLLALGFDVKDIVAFMTCDAVSFIEQASQENIFNEYSSNLELITKGLINYLQNPNFKDRNNHDLFFEFLENKSPEEKAELLEDALEFKRILEGANEFSNLGRGLGINQGVPTTKESLAGWKRFFKGIISQREEVLGITKDGVPNNHELSDQRVEFNFDEYISNPEYRRQLIEYYDKIKVTVNPFAIFEYVPHFKAMFDMLGVVATMDSVSLKSQLNNIYMEEASSIMVSIADDVTNRINAGIDTLLIQSYFQQTHLSFPLQNGYIIFGSEGQRIPTSSGNLLLNTPNALKSFHFIFNNYVIPQLQSGTFFKNNITLKDGTELSATQANALLKENAFIQGLVSGNDGNRPIYKLDIDMTNIDQSTLTKLKFQNYLNGFIELNNIDINGSSLADWFMVYNLIVNKNNYGRDRLTTLFQEVLKDGDYILSDYLRYIGNRDRDKSILEELHNENSLVSILQSNAKVVRSKLGQRDLFIKTYDQEGHPHYWKNNKKGKTSFRDSDYIEVFNGIPDIQGESQAENRQRIADNEEYGFGLLSSNYVNYILENLDNSWATIMGELLEKGYIQLINNCE